MIPIKIQCGCGQKYAFDVEPVNGRMAVAVACPVCGADGTAAADAVIAQALAAEPAAVPASGARLRTATPTITPPARPMPSSSLPRTPVSSATAFTKLQIAHKIIAILWFLLFSFILVFWFWGFVKKTSPEAGYMRVFVTPVLLFGAIASFFLFRGARWARITMGVVAGLIGVLNTWYAFETEWDWLGISIGILSLTSVALLFIPAHEPLA